MRATVLAFPGLRAKEAVEVARQMVRGPQWQLGFVSTSGVTCSVVSPAYTDPDECLMQPDGTAGQWVVEFYRVPSSPTAGPHGYRIRSVVVTPFDLNVLPDEEFVQLGELLPLCDEDVVCLEGARRWATHQVHKHYDSLAVRSDVRASGCSWEFSFMRRGLLHASQEIVARVRVPGQG